MWRRCGRYCVGVGAGGAGAWAAFTFDAPAHARRRWVPRDERECALSPDEWRSFIYFDGNMISHDTKVMNFKLPRLDMKHGLTCSSCVVVRTYDDEGNEVIRPYTPINRTDHETMHDGEISLCIKKYPGGKAGTYLHQMLPGERLEFKGPFSKFPVEPGQYKKIGMICAGSGITPMFQIIQHLTGHEDNPTHVNCIYANDGPGDILLHDKINHLQRCYDRLRMYFVVKNAPRGWMGAIGYITPEQVRAMMPKPGEGPVLVCGPPGLMKHISGELDYTQKPPAQGELSGILKDLGYSSSDVYKF